MSIPLAEQLRPRELSAFIGQDAVAGPKGLVHTLLQSAEESSFFPSLILWGPPGCGKTTLARIIARTLKRPFYEFSAVNTSIKEIEKIVDAAKPQAQASILKSPPPIIFIDEVHRFNKAQQDTLLPHVENGTITLLGATTENPSFSVIRALLSRCRVVTLEELSEENLRTVVQKGLASLKRALKPDAENFLVRASNGDARVALTVLEIAAQLSTKKMISISDLEHGLQKRQLGFDHGGEEYYNTISALHKSIRGSDPNASLYWLARMLEAGQDPLYIARRLIRLASEDIGVINPQALLIANAAYDACTHIGMPECKLALAQAVAYLAKTPKSNALYKAYQAAAQDVQEFGNLPVPLHIRNAPTPHMKAWGYGKDYDYSHSPEGKKKEGIEYFPDELHGRTYFEGE